MDKRSLYEVFLEELAEETEEREFTYEERLMAYAYFQAHAEMKQITLTELKDLQKKLDLSDKDIQKLRV